MVELMGILLRSHSVWNWALSGDFEDYFDFCSWQSLLQKSVAGLCEQ